MKGKEIIFALSILTLPAPTLAGTPKMMVEAQTSTTIRQQMDWLHRIRKINFVYDSLLDGELNIKYHGPDIQHLSVKKALKALFEKTHILYNINANYVILKRKPVQQISTSYTNINHKVQQVQRRHTLSGYVRDESGESLINATIYDLTDGIGTTTNEYGFFSLTLPEGEHQLRFSYLQFQCRCGEECGFLQERLSCTIWWKIVVGGGCAYCRWKHESVSWCLSHRTARCQCTV